MATSWSLTPAEADLVSSLVEDEIPTKLRCAICSRLAVNAYKLPCCEQLIDNSCHATLPSTCPVCEHTPLSAEDCKPNKAMRSTIKVFVKTELKKRENTKAREPKEATQATPVEPTLASQPTDGAGEVIAAEPVSIDAGDNSAQTMAESGSAEIRQGSEGQAAGQAEPGPTDTAHEGRTMPDLGSGDGQNPIETDIIVTKDRNDAGHERVESTAGGQPSVNPQGGFSNNNMTFDNASGFSNMNFGGDLNQMQMMMAMQNGMMPNSFNFPMMGMDPMMQNMYMNNGFGNQGMGMNGMNGIYMMGGGYGVAGSGSNNWNGQQSWSNGQNNYNHPSAAGMGNGDYGSYNSGFAPNYNQGKYGHQNQYGYNRGFGRGRGRGRGFHGGYGRGGGYNNFGQSFQEQQHVAPRSDAQGQQMNAPEAGQKAVSTSGEPAAGNVDEYGRSVRLRSEPVGERQDPPQVGDACTESAEMQPGKGHVDREEAKESAAADSVDKHALVTDSSAVPLTGQPIPAYDDPQPAQQGDFVSVGDSIQSSGSLHGTAHSHAEYGSVAAVVVSTPSAPLNAPLGPKAMRQGLPNTSIVNLRARGYLDREQTSDSPVDNRHGLPSPRDERNNSRSRSPRQTDHARREHRGEQDRNARGDDRPQDREMGRSASHSSQSRSPDRRNFHRRDRHPSESRSNDDRDEHHDRRGRRREVRKHSTYGEDAQPKTSHTRDEKRGEISRSLSPAESRRHGHRESRRDRDLEKPRDRDRAKGRDSSRDHRRHPQRDRGRDREHDREHIREHSRDRDRDRERTREKDRGGRNKERDRDHDRRRDHDRTSRRHSSKAPLDGPAASVRASEKDTQTSSGPRHSSSRSFEIRGASRKPQEATDPKRRPSQASASTPTAAGATDPYAEEREKRRRERLLAETKKLAGLSNFAGSKRGRDDGDDDRPGRRKSRRGTAVPIDEVTERLRRGEAEREDRGR